MKKSKNEINDNSSVNNNKINIRTKRHQVFNIHKKVVRFWKSTALFQSIMLFIFIIVFGILSFTAPHFASSGNLLNVLRQAAPTLIVAVGMTIVITSGGIDLSVGSMLAVSSVLSAMALSSGWYTIITVIVMMVLGSAIGAMNGFFVGYQRIPPFIITLASLSILRGIVLVLTEGYSIPVPPESDFIFIGRGWVMGVPVPALIAIFIVICGILLLYRTRFGLHVTGIGTNEEAVRRAGVNTKRTKLYIYTLNGFLASIGGMVVGARLASGSSYTGVGFELTVIAAVILGGTDLFGGDGRMLGTILGAMLLAIIGNGLILLHVSAFYVQIVEGIVLLLAIWANQLFSKK